MEGREGSGDGRVMSEATGTGGGRCSRKNGLGLLPKDPSQPDLGQREASPTIGKGQVGAGEREWRKCVWAEQCDSRWGSIKSPGQTSSNVSGSLCRQSVMPSQAQQTCRHEGRARHFLPPFLRKRFFRSSLQQLPKCPGLWPLPGTRYSELLLRV